jgi:hypothetical protein
MYQLSASLRLRPIRVGFLVDPADLASLVQIMRMSSCICGGIYNPIIPVCKAVPEIWTRALPELPPNSIRLAKRYIELFEPDVYVQAGPDLLGLDVQSMSKVPNRYCSDPYRIDFIGCATSAKSVLSTQKNFS